MAEEKQDEELTQEEINDKVGPAAPGGRPEKTKKNEMLAWIQEKVAEGKKRKTEIILDAEEKFGIPYRTSTGLHNEPRLSLAALEAKANRKKAKKAKKAVKKKATTS